MIKPDNVLKEINLLLLEYKSTDDDSRIVNVLEAVDKEKQLSKQEERARIIPKIHKIRAGCPAKSFARQQAKELLKELMEVEK